MLKGQVCIVTGSSTGLGAVMATKFAKEQVDGIVLHGRNVDALNKVKGQCVQNGISDKNIIIVSGDITDGIVQQKPINETLNHFNRIDILVNNAGMYDMAGALNSTMETFDQVWNVNVRSLVSLTKLCVPHLVKSKGNIVNVSSGLAVKAEPFAAFYNTGCRSWPFH